MAMPAFWSSLSPLRLSSALDGLQQRDAAAGDDAFFHRRAGGVQRVVDAVLLLLHFDFGRAADADHRNAAGQLGQTFLQLFLVVVARWCLRSGCLIWPMRRFDVRSSSPAPSTMVVSSLVIDDLLGLAEHVERDVLELDAEVFADDLAAGEDGDVFQHGLAAIAEARRLHRRDLAGRRAAC